MLQTVLERADVLCLDLLNNSGFFTHKGPGELDHVTNYVALEALPEFAALRKLISTSQRCLALDNDPSLCILHL